MDATTSKKLLWDERETAERLNVARSTLWRLRRDGRLPYVTVGRAIRYRVADVHDFIERNTREGEI